MGIQDTDKFFWHRYVEAYEARFSRLGSVHAILEFGVNHGDSIRWLRDRFPDAEIVGVDILPVQADWPQDDRIRYRQIDQGRRADVKALFHDLGITFDVVIEDGSHIPQHQATCLVEALPWLRAGGLYILEDISTSHPAHPDFAPMSLQQGRRQPNALNVLMAIQHAKEIGRDLTPAQEQNLAAPGFFSAAEVQGLAEHIAELDLFKRSKLPLRCWRCGSSDFDYVGWTCACGTDLCAAADSMSYMITVGERSRVSLPVVSDRRAIVSFYMDNVPLDLVAHQRRVLERFAPPGYEIRQIRTERRHGDAMDAVMEAEEFAVVVFLDIDCVPLHAVAISDLADRAEQGVLAGAAQRANHIPNGGHIYAGPFCMALSHDLWTRLGRPSFAETARGDVGEELTWRCEAEGQPVHLLWPSAVETPLWPLTADRAFGTNTEYDGAFLHTFGIRFADNRDKFMARCRKLLGAETGSPELVRSAADRSHPSLVLNLTQLANLHDSDKGSTVRFQHRYTVLYDLLFAPWREKPINLLEMGLAIGGPETTAGAIDRIVDSPSIKMWTTYFPAAQVFGFDISDFSHLQSDRFTFLRGDSGNVDDLGRLAGLAPCFDIILDDASHASYHQLLALKVLWPKLAPGGLYVIEDLHWQSPVFEQLLPSTPKTADVLTACFDHGAWLPNPVLQPADLVAMRQEVAAFSPFPAFDGSASPTKLIVFRKTGDARALDTAKPNGLAVASDRARAA